MVGIIVNLVPDVHHSPLNVLSIEKPCFVNVYLDVFYHHSVLARGVLFVVVQNCFEVHEEL